MSVTAEICLIWTNVARTNVSWTNVIRDSWNLFKIVPGTNLKSLVKIEPVTAEILSTLSLLVVGGGGGGGGVKSFSCKTQT